MYTKFSLLLFLPRLSRSLSGFDRQQVVRTMSSVLPAPYSVCPKCRGDGKVRQRQSKKARLHAKNNSTAVQSINWNPCNPCQGSGLQPRDPTQDVSAAAPVKNLPSVAIIGGGIGGLALGIACWHRNIPFTIYERDTSFRQRQQGYGLTLQQASKALKGFGIELEGGITSTRHVVHTPNGEEIGEWGLRKWGRDSQKSVRRQNVHIARQALREQLLNGVGNQVEWDHQLVSLNETDDKVELTFSQKDGTTKTAKADLVVGADGIRSTIRNLLIGDIKSPLQYLGCIVILGICPLDAIEGASESELLDGHTVFQTADGTTRLYCMPFSSTEYMWQLSYPVDEKEAIATSREKRLKQAALEKCGEWHSPLPQLLNATPPELVSGYPVYDRALLETDMLSSSNRITLLGDSAHPMSPFKGQGANQAMLDALSLARALYKNPESTFLETYQEEMLARSAVKVKASADAAAFLHTDVAIQKGNVTRGAAAASNKRQASEE